MKKRLFILFLALINLGTLHNSFAQFSNIDCTNVTYLKDTFYVSLNNNIIENTIYYNDSTSLIYPNLCLVLDDSSFISVSYISGSITTNSNCKIFTHLTQNSSRDTLDFDFQVSFINSFSNNTVVNGRLVLGDLDSTCIHPITIILQDGTLNTTDFSIQRNIKLLKTVDFFFFFIKPAYNVPFIEIYDDGSIKKKIIIE